MAQLADLNLRIRSKNAGPFTITVDIFCPDQACFDRLCKSFRTSAVASALGLPESEIRRFEIESLRVVKLSFPRPVVQGSRLDRDIHGAQFAVLFEHITVQ
ncbi:MAG: DUF4387 family protein [Rhodobacteraceae bacterium]|nr:DUF4387 family protein [Paracoccaceae bacterium]